MAFIEKADGTIVDTDAKKDKIKEKEQEVKNKQYALCMAEKRRNIRESTPVFTVTQFN